MNQRELEELRWCSLQPGELGDKCRARVRELMASSSSPTTTQGGSMSTQYWNPGTRLPAGGYRLAGAAPSGLPAIPPPSRGGGPQANLNLGDIGSKIGGELVGIGLDWLRGRLGGGSTNPVPGGAGPLVPSTPTVPSGGCPEGQMGIPPFCVDLIPGGGTQGGGVAIFPGEAVMGRYGAALQPSTKVKTIKRCIRGMVLGNDGLCYNKRDLNKRDRMWVPGRKPLLTGGDLNAIARASRAAGKMKTQQKRLQKLGLLPKPTGRGRGRISPHTVVGSRALPGTSIVNVD